MALSGLETGANDPKRTSSELTEGIFVRMIGVFVVGGWKALRDYAAATHGATAVRLVEQLS